MSFLTVSSSNLRPINRLQKSACGVGHRKRPVVLDIEDGVRGVHRGLVLCGLTDQTLLAGERDERRSREATLLVGDCGAQKLAIVILGIAKRGTPTDLDILALIVGNAGIGRA